MIYFFHSFPLIMASFGIFGVGIGLSYYPILKTCWKYFPEKKGLITGVVLCCFGWSPFVFTSLADAVMNGEGEENVNGYFSEKVARRMPKYAWIMAIIIASFGITALVIMFPLDNIDSTDKSDMEQREENNSQPQVVTAGNSDSDNQVQQVESSNTDKPAIIQENDVEGIEVKNQPIKQAIFSCQFQGFIWMSVGTLCKYIYIH